MINEKNLEALTIRDNLAYLEKQKQELKSSLTAMRALLAADGLDNAQIEQQLASSAAELKNVQDLISVLTAHQLMQQIKNRFTQKDMSTVLFAPTIPSASTQLTDTPLDRELLKEISRKWRING